MVMHTLPKKTQSRRTVCNEGRVDPFVLFKDRSPLIVCPKRIRAEKYAFGAKLKWLVGKTEIMKWLVPPVVGTGAVSHCSKSSRRVSELPTIRKQDFSRARV